MPWSKQTFEREMRKFDPLLRLRRSEVDSKFWLIERKCGRESKCRIPPSDIQKRDTFIASRDGYIHVMKVHHQLLNQRVFLELRAYDMWQFKNSGWFADMVEEEERKKIAARDRENDNKLEACHSEAYDYLHWKQGETVSGFHNKTVMT